MPGAVLTARPRRILIALLTTAFLLSVESDFASTAAKKSAPKAAPARKPAVKSSGSRTSRSSYNPRRRSRPQPFRYRLARLKLQPDRIKAIQGALAKAGYLNQEPNGKWDDPTRNAMRRYQQDHGFPGTGLPEAKSLMKLGLGPHPLPDELDSTAQASAAAASPQGAGTGGPPTEDSPGTNPQE